MAGAKEDQTNIVEQRELQSNSEDVEMKEVAPVINEVASAINGTETKTEESNTEKDSASQPATSASV